MRLRFLWIGPTRDRHYRSLEERYSQRLSRFFGVRVDSVAEEKKTDPRQHDAMLEREARAVEARLEAKAYLVVLDEKGKKLTSEGLSEFVATRMETSTPELTFVTGGHHGLPSRLRERADLVLSLGPMTLPHELARVVVLEQLYRAATLIKGLPYHR